MNKLFSSNLLKVVPMYHRRMRSLFHVVTARKLIMIHPTMGVQILSMWQLWTMGGQPRRGSDHELQWIWV